MESLLFFKQYVTHFRTTGSILPSGRALAAALCRQVSNGNPANSSAGRTILEVGPGTGAVTRKLVTCLGPNDRLTLVELNDAFVEHLQRRFATEPRFQAVGERCRVVHGRLEDLAADVKYDCIISGLPLNNFGVAEVEQILGVYRQLLAPGGVLSFFEYMAMRPMKRSISGRDERARIDGIERGLKRLFTEGKAEREWIWPNIPPAWVNHVRFGQPAVARP